MQHARALTVAGCVMVFGLAALSFWLGPLPVPRPHLLPVETLPLVLGDWHGGPVQPVDPDIQARLPTSHIFDRPYTDRWGRGADVMLVTASDVVDIHSPLDCFPSQGWRLTNPRTALLDGQPVNIMDARQGDQGFVVLYWTTGYYSPPPSPSPLVRRISAARQRLVERLVRTREGTSLFVRVMLPSSTSDDRAVLGLGRLLVPPIRRMVDAARTPARQACSDPQGNKETDAKRPHARRSNG